MQYAKIHSQRRSIARTTTASSVKALAPQGVCADHTVARGEPYRRKRLSLLGQTAPESEPQIVYDVLTSPGQPLDAMTQDFMGSCFVRDSVVPLERVGNDRVYILQETVPIDPSYTNARRIADYDWSLVPPVRSDDLGRGKSP
jgi:hypothetical protein